MSLRVCVIGGGLGGLAAGIALRRHDYTVDVYERALELREIGAWIVVPPNAARALEVLLGPELRLLLRLYVQLPL